MTPKKKFKTDAFAAIHESALALHGVGAIDKATMRKFDESCIAKTPTFEATQIKHLVNADLAEMHDMLRRARVHMLETVL